MKILMLTPYLPYPPASGGQIRSYNLLHYLSKNHEITLVSLYKNENEKKYAQHLQPYCKDIHLCKRPEKPWQINNILKAIFSLLPFLIVRNYSPQAKDLIQRLLTRNTYDIIHVETFYIMPHIPKTTTPILLVEQTIEFKVYLHFIRSLAWYMRYPLYVDILKLRYWEKYYWQKARIVAAVSRADEGIIKSIEPTINSIVLPNGAGDEMFVTRFSPANLNRPIVLFVGNYYWLQNIEAAEYIIQHIAPELKKEIPHATILIAGQNANVKLGSHNGGNIKIVDLKPDDQETVRDLYHQATLFIAPIFGPGGTRLKILAAMASGLPVIATQTGIEGLEIEDAKHALVAKNAKDFIKQIKIVLGNKHLYETMREEAHNLATHEYSWHAITKKLEKVYKEIV